jgi:hypothetical protein
MSIDECAGDFAIVVVVAGVTANDHLRTRQHVEIREQSGITKFRLDIDRKSTTIWLWIGWVLHLRLCLIPPAGRWSNDSHMGPPLCID